MRQACPLTDGSDPSCRRTTVVDRHGLGPAWRTAASVSSQPMSPGRGVGRASHTRGTSDRRAPGPKFSRRRAVDHIVRLAPERRQDAADHGRTSVGRSMWVPLWGRPVHLPPSATVVAAWKGDLTLPSGSHRRYRDSVCGHAVGES
jgi:hypothetical protein